MPEEIQQTETAAVTHQPRGLSRLIVIIVGVIVALVLVLVPANNSGAAAAQAGILTLIAVALLDWALFCSKRLAMLRLFLACMIGGGIGYYFQLTENIAFQKSFGTEPPSSIRDIRVAGHYVGRLGDLAILIQFSADEKSLDTLLAQRMFDRQSEEETWWSREPTEVWRLLFGNYSDAYGGDAWLNIKPPGDIRIFKWQGDEPTERTTVLWDAETGRTYVLYGFG
ncbi:MAG: hypothetical protein ABIG44_06960 [Planctomycetota bacterium]